MGFEYVWLLHFKFGSSGGLFIHFKENDEDMLRTHGSGTEGDAQFLSPSSLSNSSLNAMVQNVCFFLTDEKSVLSQNFLKVGK